MTLLKHALRGGKGDRRADQHPRGDPENLTDKPDFAATRAMMQTGGQAAARRMSPTDWCPGTDAPASTRRQHLKVADQITFTVVPIFTRS
ncbi:hypothetical protein [Tepidamorphus gemmatus]|uniref:hypothetical protein n=1 Tax=Tepidamorphus gemmatus TaxID=747076 RepID=UPI00104A1F87|nr:hypothetical protein [Tepidamorphus gemmatus]